MNVCHVPVLSNRVDSADSTATGARESFAAGRSLPNQTAMFSGYALHKPQNRITRTILTNWLCAGPQSLDASSIRRPLSVGITPRFV